MNQSQSGFPEQGTIVYIVKMFPRLSETFITQEILELEKRGFNLHIYSLKKPSDRRTLAILESVKSPVTHLPDSLISEFWNFGKDQWGFLIKSPTLYLKSLFYTLHKLNWMSLKRFFQAVCLAQDIRGKPVVHIHAGFAHSPATVALALHRLTGIPYSFTGHAKDLYLSEQDSLRNKIVSAKFVFTCTQYNKSFLDGLVSHKHQKKIYQIYHGIQSDKFQRNGHIPEEKIHILSVGRLVEKKGHEYLIEACRILHGKGYKFRCDIVGGGTLQTYLEEKIKSYGLQDMVELHGAKSQDELMDYYRKSTIFAAPCIVAQNGDRDGIPNVLTEAMAMEIAIVATNISGIPELVQNGENGLLVAEKDGIQLANAISRLIDQPDFRNKLVKNALETVHEKFDSSTHAEYLSNLFHQRITDNL